MVRHDHLRLVLLPEQLERRRRRGGGVAPSHEPRAHSRKLQAELEATVSDQQRRRPPQFVDPSLILRVRMIGMTMEKDWNDLGLTLLGSDEDKTLVLFATDEELRGFCDRLAAYARGTPPDRKKPAHAGFIDRVMEIGPVRPCDRLGARLRQEGFTDADDFAPNRAFLIDVELWDLGRRDLRTRSLEQIAEYIRANGGEVLDSYLGPSITMLRARLDGAIVRTLLGLEVISTIDLPPEPDVVTGMALDLPLANLPALEPVPDEAPVIGVIDSGINEHPLLTDVLVGAIGVPAALGTADDWGHGTRVSGVALFGDLRGQIAGGVLERVARIASAKVVNESGAFDECRLVPSQMREALTTLNERFGCRLFVISLGDTKRIYDGGKVGPWAATLDELARELDAVIVVSAGNRSPRPDYSLSLEQAVTDYPKYLLEPTNRFCEPAGAINVLTVGSLAHGEGLGRESEEDVHVMSITRALEPSPFSRIGPGIGGAVKPDFVEIGGTMVFDPIAARLQKGETFPTAGLLTLHHNFLDRLFTAGSGTSYAAPMLAHKAAQILTRFPKASANLVRALLAGAADVPEEARLKLQALGDEAVRSVCGHGRVEPARAAYSDDHRVVLYADDALPLDHFAVYQIPIPDEFKGDGRRTIRVALAFDPPVRHTRTDYAGVSMSFRLVRGCDPALIIEHYRRRTQAEGRRPDIDNRYNCGLDPGPRERERGTLQSASVTFSRGTKIYGDNYYLVVRCEGGWATNSMTEQRFAAVVELTHHAKIKLYERLRARVRLRT